MAGLAGSPLTVVGVTGHRALADEAAVAGELASRLARVERPLVGVTALAAGADQLFADAILAAGGVLQVIVPAEDYRETLPPEARAAFDRSMDAATEVTTLDRPHAGSGAYLEAGLELLRRSDVLFAVWDGTPSRGSGGTADMVARAREGGVPVEIIHAERAERYQPSVPGSPLNGPTTRDVIQPP